jgi:hypothetical protein
MINPYVDLGALGSGDRGDFEANGALQADMVYVALSLAAWLRRYEDPPARL